LWDTALSNTGTFLYLDLGERFCPPVTSQRERNVVTTTTTTTGKRNNREIIEK